MARLRVIDVEIPDSQVQAVLNTFFPGAAPGPLVDAPLALPAAPEPALPAPDPEIEAEPAAPRVTRKPRRKLHAPAAPSTAAAKSMSVSDRIMLSLPGTLQRIAERAGKTKSSTSGVLTYLRKRGKVVLEGGVWSRAGADDAIRVAPPPPRKRTPAVTVASAAPPTPTARREAGPKPTIKAPPAAVPASDPPAPADPPKTTRELFRDCLESGPHTERELIQFARAAGKSPTEHMADEILNTMARHGEALYGEDGRWAAGGTA